MKPGTTIDSLFYKIRQIMKALNSLSMEQFYPLLVISVMDPVRFKGVKDRFYGIWCFVNATIQELKIMMRQDQRVIIKCSMGLIILSLVLEFSVPVKAGCRYS